MQVELYPENFQHGEIKTSKENDSIIQFDQVIKRIVEREGFLKYKIEKKCVSTNGGNYLGLLYEIDIIGITKDEEKELHIFVKNMVDPEALKVISVTEVYKTEMFAYKELSKIFEELQENANVPLDERYKMVKVYEESNSETIFMENLAKKGFTTYFRMDAAPLDFMELAVQQLAKFHGLSFVLKAKRPEYFETNIKNKQYPFVFKKDWHDMVKSMREAIIKYVDEEFKDRIEKVYLELGTKYKHNLTDEKNNVCLCHGDYRPNNIMTKIENGTVKELIPVDYQILHYGCPVMDFFYLIFMSTERELRRDHLSNLKHLYYETLGNFLDYFDINVEAVYPRNGFEKVYKEKVDHGLMLSLMFYPFLFASEDDVPDMTKKIVDQPFLVDDRIRERLRGVIEDFVEWGYL